MHLGTTTSGARRLPRARVTLPIIGLLVAAFVAKPMMRSAAPLGEAAVLSLASERGMIPLDAFPERGTEVFQWDAELREFTPFFVGIVQSSDVGEKGEHLVLVKRPHAPALLLKVRDHEMRYWVRKP